MVALDATKPLHMDDALWVQYARHIATDPISPYGFEPLYQQARLPANDIVGASPVFLYAWAGAVALFGEEAPWAWRLAHLPFLLALALGTVLLGARIAPRRLPTLLVLVVASPAVLVSMNMMLDVPTLGLEVLAIALFERASRSGRRGLAAAAGVVAGLAIETKLSAVGIPIAMVLMGAARGSARLTVIALGWTACVVLSVEAFVAVRHGSSHVMAALAGTNHHPLRPGARLGLLTGLPWLVGPLMLGPLVSLLAGGAASRRLPLAAAAAAGAIGVALGDPFDHSLSLALGAAFLVAVARQASSARDRTSAAILAWIAAELVALLVVSPFLCVRRVLGLLAACTFLACRQARLGRANADGRRAERCAAAVSLVTALGLFAADRAAAEAERDVAWATAERSANLVGPRYFMGSYGFQEAALHAGLSPLILNQTPLVSGAVVIVAHQPTVSATPVPHTRPLEALERGAGPIPVSTAPWFYIGKQALRFPARPAAYATITRIELPAGAADGEGR
ncbi:MAG: hypothetical protein M9894_39210 [Planctomycetes bacterium]|nr:hypothetical protein [Planctomycetota bacterium]